MTAHVVVVIDHQIADERVAKYRSMKTTVQAAVGVRPSRTRRLWPLGIVMQETPSTPTPILTR